MDDSGTGMIAENPAQAAFWEYPILPAGQTKLTQGTLTIKKTRGGMPRCGSKRSSCPDDDPAALDYLAALTITIRDGDAVLYNGPYSAINDGGLQLTVPVASGQMKSYTISPTLRFCV